MQQTDGPAHGSLRSEQWETRIFFFLLAIIILAQLFHAWRPLSDLVTRILPDDAFYYFQIGRNIAAGAGSTFDGISPTNGYHPLWMAVTAFVYHLTGPGNPVLPINILLTIAVACEVGGLIILRNLLRKMGIRPIIRITALTLFALNPFVLFEFMNGLETALAFLLFSAFILTWISTAENTRPLRYALLGLVGGLMILARTDHILFFGAPILLLFLERKENWLKRISLFAGTGFLVVLPWILWNLFVFGSIVQTSGAAFTEVQRQLVAHANGHLPAWYYMTKASFSKTVEGLSFLLTQTGAPFIYLFVAGLLAGVTVRAPRDTEQRPFNRILMALGVTVTAYFFAQVTIRWAIRSWYFIPVIATAVIMLAMWTERVLPEIRLTRKSLIAMAGVSAVVALSFFWALWKDVGPRYTHQIEMIEAAEWANQNISGEPRRIGIFNAGIQGYLSRHHVINLDGLVNNEAARALSDKHLLEFVRSSDIGILMDYDRAILFKFGPAWGVPDIRTELSDGQSVTHKGLFDPGGVKLYLVN